MSYSSSVTIVELSPDGASIQLQGASLPFMGAEWGGENRLTTTWYPGNPDEATQQVLGPRELPTHWEGEWNRTRMGRDDSLATIVDSSGTNRAKDPFVLRDALENMFRRGHRLAVSWIVRGDDFSQNNTLYREGRAKSWKFKYTRLQDIEWEVELEWIGRGKSVQRVVSTRDDSATNAFSPLNADTIKALAAWENAKNALDFKKQIGSLSKISQAFSGIDSLTRGIQASVSQIQNAIDVGLKTATLPLSVANQLVDLARNTIAVAHNIEAQISRIPAEIAVVNRKASAVAKAAKHLGTVGDATGLVSRSAQTMNDKVTTIVPTGPNANARSSDVLAIYITKAGDTPQNVSILFYKTADHGVDILKANRLPWYQPTFPQGTVLVIPVLQTIKKA